MAFPRSPAASLLVVLAVAPSCGACKRKPTCHGELTSDDLYRLQQLDVEGVDPCPELSKPVVDLTTDGGLQIDGRPLARLAVLPGDGAHKIEPLFDYLRSSREVWKQVHPTRSFDPELTLRVSPNIDTDVVANVLRTSAFVGYPNMHIDSGGVGLTNGWNVPGPPSDEPRDAPVVIRVGLAANGAYRVQFEGPATVSQRSGELRTVDQIAPWVETQCARASGRCARAVAVDIRGPFVGTLTLLRDVLRLPVLAAHPPWVEIGGAQP